MLLSSEFRPCEAHFEDMFAATLTGQEHDFALVFVHGFLGRGDDWHEVTERLCVNFQCLTIDLPGHGNSQHIEVKGFNDTVEGLIKTILKHIKVPFFLVGYSLGARLSMYLCAKKFQIFDDKPCTLLGLFIESGHPGLTDVDRKPRQDNDEAWARRFEQAPLLNVLEQWYSQPVFFSENFDKKQKLIKKRSDNLGEKVASMLRATSLSKQPCLRDELVRCGVPFYFIFGNDDQKFASIGQSLGCECHGVNNAGHNVHNEQPELFSGLIRKLVKKTRIKTSDVKNAHLQIIKKVNIMARTIGLTEQERYGPIEWNDKSKEYEDILYHKSKEGIARITINRPQVRNAFRPQTVKEMIHALSDARYDGKIGVIVLTGFGEDAFCSGGDQKVRGNYGGYKDEEGTHHLNVLDFQRQIRTCPKPIIASVAGYAVGGGHVLHMMCDLTIAAENAQFGQTGPKVGSFDGGWGASYMARIVGQKKAREIWFLCRFYDAKEALDMGLVNHVVPNAELERETVRWCREMLQHSPMALRCLKAALNADCDGQAGLQELAGNATMLFYMTEEGQEGRNAFNEQRKPDFDKFPRNP